ncbi:MAG: efflux RND transporter periplasmic adaptor subunit [Succinivibrionaceae bacterium]|nr:efflux RND transporter periplasmic adaptor subunit [Succinivibrionaceae bacterium]
MKNKFKLLSVCLAMMTSSLLTGCLNEEQTQAQAGGQLLPVKFVPVSKQDVTVELNLQGRTNALREAEVRPQVSGIILKRLFTEGSEVKQGQQLYQIDPATYEASLAAAKADLAKAEASAYSITVRAQRYEQLLKTKAVSQQDYDDAIANKKSAEAQILAAKAAVRTAEINLAYTKVYAPISGIISKSDFTEGALVTANQPSPLTTIKQLDPIYVDVGESINDLLQTRREIADGTIHLNKDNKVEVSLLFENGEKYPEPATLEFTGVSVDQSTGMVNLRATANNKDHVLLPGMFMRVKFPKGIQKNAMIIPLVAVVRANRSDKYVFVIDEKNTIQQKFIELGPEVGTNVVVKSGLDENDRVVVTNQQKIRVGMPVNPVDSTKAQEEAEQKSAEQQTGTK